MGREARMVGLAEAAQQLQLPYQDAHRLLLTGRIRGEKSGGRWLVRLDDVQRLLVERSRDTTGTSR